MAGPNRRSRAEGGRPHTVAVSYSDLEMAKVTSAAARDALALGAWLADAGVRVADAGVPAAVGSGAEMQELMELRDALGDARRLLRNVGGNLNDVARHANSTGELHGSTAVVQAHVARAVARVDRVVVQLDARLRVVRGEVRGQRR
ncbi:MAG: hypothetical protein AB7I38_11635 [Dehalococcoidia bacterium]